MYRKSNPLSYPLRLPDEMQSPAADLLTFSLLYIQQVVDQLWPRLDEIGQIAGDHIWKHLEGWLPRPDDLPSRLWRCILEGAGRTLRAQADRKRVFELLLPLLEDEYFGDDNGDLILSFDIPTDLSAMGGGIYMPADMVRFQRTGPSCSNWTDAGHYFDSSTSAPASVTPSV